MDAKTSRFEKGLFLVLAAIGCLILAACRIASGTSPLDEPVAPTPSFPPPQTNTAPSPTATTTGLPSATGTSPRALTLRLDRWSSLDGPVDLEWSPDGGLIAVTTANGVSLSDAATLEEIAFQETPYGQNALAFSGDGGRLATADDWEAGRRFRIWDGHDLALLGEYDLPGSGVTKGAAIALDFLGDGGVVLAASELAGLGIWTSATDESMTRNLSVKAAEPLTAVLDSSQSRVAVAVGPAEAVQVWDIATGEMIEEAPLAGASRLGFTHDGRFLLALLNFEAAIWDLQSERLAGEIPIADGAAGGPAIPFRLSVSHDDRLLASGTEMPSPGIGIWELESGQLLGLLAHEDLERVRELSFSPATDELAILLSDGRLEVWTIEE